MQRPRAGSRTVASKWRFSRTTNSRTPHRKAKSINRTGTIVSPAGRSAHGGGLRTVAADVILRRLLPVAACLLFLCSSLSAQWLGDAESELHTRKGIDFIYNLKFDSARAELRFLIKHQPDHPAGYFFLAMIDWWRIVTDFGNTAYDEKLLRELDRVIDLCDQRLDKNENDLPALFFKGGALGFEGRLHGNREDWVKAANCGREALPIVRKAYHLDTANYDILLGMGIYNYYAAVVPDHYPFVKPLMVFFPEGDRARGMRQLRLAADSARYAGVEAQYFLMQICLNFENNYPEALRLAISLTSRYPDNPLFQRYLGRCNASNLRWSEAETVFEEILHRTKEQRPGYDRYTEREAEYYLGWIEMNRGDLEKALSFLYHTDDLSRALDVKGASGFMALANLRIGMIYDLQKKRDLAVAQYKKVLDMNDFQNAHTQASRYLASAYTGN
ncbi:MAG TPA: tetratricopeptide repeat protein [Bacteroidota bacterium]|nr:tetratricopeptide repeat protein [Bacteroidota bacterium]